MSQASEASLRLRRVIKAQHGRSRPAPKGSPERLEAVGETWERPRRASFFGGDRVRPEPCSGDDAERALAAHEHAREVRAHGRARPGPPSGQLARVHDGPVGKNHFETGDHVLDLPVAGGVLARAATRDHPPMVASVDRLGPVTDRHRVPRAKLPLEIVPESSCPDVDERGRAVRLLDALKAAAVEADTSEDRDGAAADPASPPGGGDRDAGFVAAPEHGGDFGGRGRPSYDPGSGGHGTGERPSERDGPPVPARLG